MAKYKIIKEFVLNGNRLKEGSIINLNHTQSNLKSIQKNIEMVPDITPVDGQKESVLSSVVPGTPLTPEQKEKLTAENIKLSEEANKQAAEHLVQDRIEGKGEPVVKGVAEAIQNKLQNEEFEKKAE